MRCKITDKEIDTMVFLRSIGKSNAEIAAMLDRSVQGVRNVIGVEGTPREIAEKNYADHKKKSLESWNKRNARKAPEQTPLEIPFCDDFAETAECSDEYAVLLEIRGLLQILVDKA